MIVEMSLIAALLGLAVLGWRLNRSHAAARRQREEDARVFTPHDHARTHERAQIQSDLSRWSGL